MKEQEIIAGNRLIAEFMGMEYERTLDVFDEKTWREYFYSKGHPWQYNETTRWQHTLTDLRFHHSWNWLMPVVEKIGLMRGWNVNLGFGDPVIFDDDYKQTGRGKRFAVCEPTKDWRQCTWETVVVFLKYQKTGVLQSNNEEGKGE